MVYVVEFFHVVKKDYSDRCWRTICRLRPVVDIEIVAIDIKDFDITPNWLGLIWRKLADPGTIYFTAKSFIGRIMFTNFC